jgi:hypothetical protein
LVKCSTTSRRARLAAGLTAATSAASDSRHHILGTGQIPEHHVSEPDQSQGAGLVERADRRTHSVIGVTAQLDRPWKAQGARTIPVIAFHA